MGEKENTFLSVSAFAVFIKNLMFLAALRCCLTPVAESVPGICNREEMVIVWISEYNEHGSLNNAADKENSSEKYSTDVEHAFENAIAS